MSCRQCSVCEGLEHHLRPNIDEETEEAFMQCAHCPYKRPMTDEDFDAEIDFEQYEVGD